MKKIHILPGLFLAICVAFPAANALAQDEFDEEGGGAELGDRLDPVAGTADRRFYFAGMLSGIANDTDRELSTGYGGQLALGKRITSGLNLELTGFYTTAALNLPGNALDGEAQTLAGFGVGAMVFPLSSLPNLYSVVGVYRGTGDISAADYTYTGTVFDIGFGYLYRLNEWLFLRGEAKYRMDQHNTRGEPTQANPDHDSYDGVFNVGVHIPLGIVALPPPPPVEVVPVDSDGDGVPDDADKCPDTPAGVAVDESGCEGDTDGDGIVDRLDQCPDTPAGTAVNEVGCVGDSDGDGVPDDLDTCPDTPAGTAVNDVGCVGDSDGDGVPDDQDTCPGTPAGVTVDESGCEVKEATGCRPPKPGEPIDLEGCATGESIVLKGVNFELASDRLTANARAILKQVSDSLIANSSLRVEVGGHTDSQGGDDYNQQLSEKRAKSVMEFLVSRGVDAGRITAVGYGETQPIDTNETADGREANRRVELKVIE